MCLSDDCEHGGTDRRSFLVGAAAAVAGFSVRQEAAPQTRQPETRVLDWSRTAQFLRKHLN
ncbi:MAG TPA: twin-arginine translocation signal domain-containing protein [Pyrinomonadaceae bacterium]|nr:twin-arginine translocation signal domain-containing protein [Pyrinomonadaceae bacterium]